MPSEAKGTGAKAAKAFVRYYFEAINYAARTGNIEMLSQLASDACESCRSIEHQIESTYSAGGYIKSGGWRVTLVSAVPSQPRSKPILDLGVIQSPEIVVTERGAAEKRFPGGKRPMTMYLRREPSGWLVTRLDVVNS